MKQIIWIIFLIWSSVLTPHLSYSEEIIIFEDLINQGLQAQWQTDYSKAIENYQKVLALEPQDKDCLRLAGICYFYMNNFHEAINYLLLAKEQDQDNYEIYFNLGRVYFAQGQDEQAAEYFYQTIKSNKEFNLGYYYLAQTLERQGKIEEALSYYLKTFEKDANFLEVRLDLARIYEKLARWDDAWAQYSKILIVVPTHTEALTEREKITALLVKKPEEIIPLKKIIQPTSVLPILEAQNIPLVRIGIGTEGKGVPVYKEAIEFRVSSPFVIKNKSTQEIILNGEKQKIYLLGLKNKKEITIGDEVNVILTSTNQPILIQPEEFANNTIIINQIKYATGFAWGGKEDREYRGLMEVSVQPEFGLNLVNIINMEEYLYSVLPSEMISSWPMDALKAQAVVARGEVWYKKDYTQPHQALGYEVCDSQHCQVYSGVKSENKRSRLAVEETRGEIPIYQEKIAHTLYSSNCGGHTQSSSELKGWGEEPYLKSIIDGENILPPKTNLELENWIKHTPQVYCHISKYCYPAEFRWARVFSRKDLEQSINQTYTIGQIKAIIPKIRSKSGHINGIEIKGTKKDILIEKEHLIRQIFGLGFLRSTLFIIETRMGPDALPESFTFYGGGWGHGVGMCQTGAAGMAEKGLDYKTILKHYYVGIEIEKKEY